MIKYLCGSTRESRALSKVRGPDTRILKAGAVATGRGSSGLSWAAREGAVTGIHHAGAKGSGRGSRRGSEYLKAVWPEMFGLVFG